MEKNLIPFVVSIGIVVILSHIVHAQWVPTNSPIDVAVSDFAVKDSNLFFSTYDSGVFISTDNGKNWTSTNISDKCIYCLAVSGDTIFAGGGDVFRSTDNGENWARAGSGVSGVKALTVSEGNIYAGVTHANRSSMSCGVYLSTDNGTSWSELITNVSYSIGTLVVSGSNIFAGVDQGLYLSTNSGTSWTKTELRIMPYVANGSNIFGTTYVNGDAAVCLSTDNGTSWVVFNDGLPSNSYFMSLVASGSNLFTAINSGHRNNTVYLSTNNGKDWIEVNDGCPVDSFILSLGVSNSDIFAGTQHNGVWRRPLSEMVELTSSKPLSKPQQKDHFRVVSAGISNSTATIQFFLPYAENVILSAYDLTGRKIVSIINRNLDAGLHQITWKTPDIATGFYFIRMKAGTYCFEKRVPFIR